MALIGNIEPFDQSKNDFVSYIERLEQLFIVNDVAAVKQLPMLITLIGPETYGVLKNLCLPSSPTDKTFDQCKTLLQNHFSPRRTVILERFKFHKRDQRSDESISEYVNQLKQLARPCEFGAFLREALRDRLICGLYNENIQKRLLAEEDITFDTACTKSISMEVALQGLKVMHGNESVAAIQSANSKDKYRSKNNINKNNKNRFSDRKGCYRCGRYHNPENCPAREWMCYKCNHKGHTATVCDRNTSKFNGRKVNVKAVTELLTSQSEDEEDALNFINVVKHNGKTDQINFACNGRISEVKQGSNRGSELEAEAVSPLVITIYVDNQPVDVETDTGACTTVMASTVHYKLFGKRKLEKFEKKIKINKR